MFSRRDLKALGRVDEKSRAQKVRKVHKSKNKKHNLRISIRVALSVLLSIHISDFIFSNRLRIVKRGREQRLI